jgi:hypothetical protein
MSRQGLGLVLDEDMREYLKTHTPDPDCTAAVDALNVTLSDLGMATYDGGVGFCLSNVTIGLCHAAHDAETARRLMRSLR